MRKTKLIILPTKCLNQMGFLLLFLSCPVIGDWGRIRPESEMSQWSILIEREGSCGLVRDSPGIENAKTPDGLMECDAADAELRNNTQSLTEKIQEPKTDFSTHPDSPIHESRIGRNIRSSRVDAERRVSNARRESQEGSFRRSVQPRQIRTERRAVSLDRQASFRYEERRSDRMQSEVRHQERDVRERNDYRRMSRSLDRRVNARRESVERRVRNDRTEDEARRLSVTRQEREVGDSFETSRRNMLQSRLSRNGRRGEERRLTGRNDARRNVRQDRHETTRRMTEREQREERRVAERRSSEERKNLEVTANRRDDRIVRVASPERRIRASNDRDIRATDRRMRDTAEISRRQEDSRRIENDPRRKQEMRVSVRRMDKPQERREVNQVAARMTEQREKSTRVDYRMNYEKEHKNARWEFLDGLKTWFGPKNDHEDRVFAHGDFATTCLVGAAVYFLTTRQVKTV